MTAVAPIRQPAGIVTGQLLLLEPGEHVFTIMDWETRRFGSWGGKLLLRLGQGSAHSVKQLTRHYNVELVGQAGKRGRFNVGPRSDLFREYAALVGDDVRLDGLDLLPLLNTGAVVEVATVTEDGKGNPLPAVAQYSTVRRIIGPYRERGSSG